MIEALTAARDRFLAEHDRFEQAAAEVAGEIDDAARLLGFAVAASGRAKTVDSFVKKALAKNDCDPWTRIIDKAGARATVADLVQQKALVAALTARWGDRVLDVQDMSLEIDVAHLAYTGVHLQVVAPRRNDDTEPLECEVQVRTAAQNVWSVMSHKYLYKPVVEPTRQTKRALWRLVALMEIVDEEVQRAVNQIITDPEYPQARLLHDVEKFFYTVSAAIGDSELSLEVLGSVIDAVPVEDRASYADTLAAFTTAQRGRLQSFYARFVEGGDLQGELRYVLATQPESLVLLERAHTTPMLLADVLQGAGVELVSMAAPLLALWGEPLLDIDPA